MWDFLDASVGQGYDCQSVFGHLKVLFLFDACLPRVFEEWLDQTEGEFFVLCDMKSVSARDFQLVSVHVFDDQLAVAFLWVDGVEDVFP